MVAYDGNTTSTADAVIAKALQSSRVYRLATVVREDDPAGPLQFYVWVKGSAVKGPSRGPPRGSRPPSSGRLALVNARFRTVIVPPDEVCAFGLKQWQTMSG